MSATTRRSPTVSNRVNPFALASVVCTVIAVLGKMVKQRRDSVSRGCRLRGWCRSRCSATDQDPEPEGCGLGLHLLGCVLSHRNRCAAEHVICFGGFARAVKQGRPKAAHRRSSCGELQWVRRWAFGSRDTVTGWPPVTPHSR